MTTEEYKSLKSVLVVDARGTAHPGPLIAAKKAIKEIKSGEILEILSADEGTKNDIPQWCENVGHKYLGFYNEESFSRLFLIKE
ncbi:MAG: sulfurtransferase TusA family protein [Paludibacter sp.]